MRCVVNITEVVNSFVLFKTLINYLIFWQVSFRLPLGVIEMLHYTPQFIAAF